MENMNITNMEIIDSLVLYKEVEYQKLFEEFVLLMNHANSPTTDCKDENKDEKSLLYSTVGKLLEFADKYGFEGNLYHCLLAFILANDENPFSTACELYGSVEGSLQTIASHDLEIFRQLFQFDLLELDRHYQANAMTMITDYKNGGRTSKVFNKRIRDRIQDLAHALEAAESVEEYYQHVTGFYKEYGVGKLGLHKAFRLTKDEENQMQITPITSVEHVYLKDLVGYELQKKKLIDNTEAFIEGRKANNVLLFGDSGTGKSSSIKAILNEYYDKGLRMIEVYKHQFGELSQLIETVKDRNYKFIIFMDDLSFEDFEIEYKYLKAMIEGGLGKKPDNVLIYATSNRRHLVREKFSDKEDRAEDLHTSDTVQEKLSLVARFGVSIYYGAPNKKEFQQIVKTLSERYGVQIPEEQLLLEANKWELSHGGLSGRTAQQFINYLLGSK